MTIRHSARTAAWKSSSRRRRRPGRIWWADGREPDGHRTSMAHEGDRALPCNAVIFLGLDLAWGAEPARWGRTISECYPYTTLVGTTELGYELERPRYKRKPKRMPAAEWNPLRCAACDDLVLRLATLATADPPLDVRSHPQTR